ncbi:MFS general substrate transporter [Trametes versicolor FP-101664 SS1]|uniref:MFS general substrate transporter n=1 Tax=Trametes versicolor (strain FP-101664) TaxID=717944 RepID=UPI00046243AB|nr:MFS general substrate transporter [Trametes versicolor FP-101664 SS1]EIW52899.1 MFS general substrate transporter [Trametes versicolor FP-101664 SS1]
MLAPPTSKSTVLSPAQTLVDGRVPQKYSPARRYVLLLIFCLAQFLDAFNNSALFSAIPSLVISLGMSEAESTWIISAFQLTFASFLLISGRISDVYNPKFAFIGGVAVLGILSIGAGFVTNKIPLIVLRALSGIAASMTIPSALTLLVNVFIEPNEQARAIGVFGGCGAVGNVLGLIIGAIFVQFASWSWVFWFVALVALPIAAICVFLIPTQEPHLEIGGQTDARWKSLDMGGVSILTAALILFIFAITSGTTSGWGSATVLAPLIISVFMVVAFFYYETTLPVDKAAIPPRTWFLPNFSVLFGTALLPYFWWTTVFTLYTTLWQDVWHWSVISTAIHMLPIGVLAFSMSFTGSLSRVINPKWIILTGEGMCIIATILLAFADGPERYWPFIFPAFVLGSAGAMLTYTHTNIAIFRTSPTSMAGTVGAIFNGALQLGSAIGISAVGSIETSVEARNGGSESYAGRAAAFWFLLAIVGIEFLALLVFYRRSKEGTAEELEGEGKTLEKTIEDEKMVMEKQSVDLPELRLTSSAQDIEREEHTTVSERPVNVGTDLNV